MFNPTRGKMRAVLPILVLSLVWTGFLPPPVLCVGERHEAHVLYGLASPHHEHSQAEHDVDEGGSPGVCGHTEVARGFCPEDECLDVVLPVDMDRRTSDRLVSGLLPTSLHGAPPDLLTTDPARSAIRTRPEVGSPGRHVLDVTGRLLI